MKSCKITISLLLMALVLVSLALIMAVLKPSSESATLTQTAAGSLIGAAKLDGYYTIVERDSATSKVECAGFVITNAPDLLTEFMQDNPVAITTDGNPTIVLGDIMGNFDEGAAASILMIIDSQEWVEEVEGCQPFPNNDLVIM